MNPHRLLPTPPGNELSTIDLLTAEDMIVAMTIDRDIRTHTTSSTSPPLGEVGDILPAMIHTDTVMGNLEHIPAVTMTTPEEARTPLRRQPRRLLRLRQGSERLLRAVTAEREKLVFSVVCSQVFCNTADIITL